MKTLQLRFIALLGIFGFISGCVSTDQSMVSGSRRAYGYTWAQEVQLGQQADGEIQGEYGMYSNAQLAAYVTRIGEKVLQYSEIRQPTAPEDRRSTPFTFRVLDSPVVNAFALPGGYIYVTRGLLAHLDNEAQLAVVLGHEIAHVVARHASQSAVRQQGAQLGVLAGVLVGAAAGVDGRILEQGMNVLGTGAQLLLLKNGREAEMESDRLGVAYAAKAGYKIADAAAFFRSLARLQEQSGQKLPIYMSSHPDPGNREQSMLQYAADYQAQGFPMSVQNQAELYAQIDGIVAGENPRQGFVENNNFYHPDLKFQYPIPTGWQVNNTASQVQMVDQAQQAMVMLDMAEGTNAREAASQFASKNKVQVVESGATRVNGLNAFAVDGAIAVEQKGNIRLRAYFIEHGGKVYQFLGYTAEQSYGTYLRAFRNIMEGFAPLNDPEKLNRQPAVIKIQNAARNAAFSTFVPNKFPTGLTAEGLAIINQLNLSDQVNTSRKLKLLKF
jgi:predicted Zn-dependent protease